MTDKEKIEELEKKIDYQQDAIEDLEYENSRYEDKVDYLNDEITELENQDNWESVFNNIGQILDRIYYTTSSDKLIEWITMKEIKKALLDIKKILCE